MSTRSRIAVRHEDGTHTSVYCHFDGYPAGVGAVLTAHYTDPAKVERLLALGDLSSLAAEIGEQHPFDSREAAHVGWCRAYGRDRGEADVAAKESPDFDDLVALTAGCWGEFLYVFADGAWRGYGVSGGPDHARAHDVAMPPHGDAP